MLIVHSDFPYLLILLYSTINSVEECLKTKVEEMVLLRVLVYELKMYEKATYPKIIA